MNKPSPFNQFMDEQTDAVLSAAAKAHSSVVCAASPGVPVIYVSDSFEAHTGYPRAEIVGKSLSILQGPETEPEAVSEFRRLIDEVTPGTVRITNYRKDGSRFVHECELRPILDEAGKATYFVAIQRPI